MKYRMVMILSVLFLFSVVGCKADTPNIKELEGYWVSDHRCIKETDYNYSTRETFVWYQPQVIRIRESKFFDLGVKVVLTSRYRRITLYLLAKCAHFQVRSRAHV